MNENERRLALADFLRKQRAHLSPADVGLPPGLRRRTPGLRREIEALKQVSPEFCQWWQEHDAPRSLDGDKIMEHSTLGHLEFQYLTLQVLSDPDIRVTIYMPNAVTRAKLQQLLEVSGWVKSHELLGEQDTCAEGFMEGQ